MGDRDGQALALAPDKMLALKDGAFVADWDAVELAARSYAATFDGIEVVDDKTRKQAAKVRADINAKKRALNDVRISLVREYDKPAREFKAKVDAVIAILDEQASYIDAKLREMDERFRETRRRLLAREYDAVAAGLAEEVPLERFIEANPKLIGRSASGTSACDMLDAAVAEAARCRASLAEQGLEFPLDADRAFCRTLSLQAALDENARLVRAREDNERRAAAMPEGIRPKPAPRTQAPRQARAQAGQAAAPVLEWEFRFKATREQAVRLRDFAKSIGVVSAGGIRRAE